MATRQANARWHLNLKDGKGKIDLGRGMFTAAYSFASRFEADAGTNPAESLGAAHASCFALALARVLSDAGFKPDYVDATASVTIRPRGGGFKITRSHLVCEAQIADIDAARFAQHVERARATCPVSQALAGTEITVDATLCTK